MGRPRQLHTYQERLIAGLKATGWQETEAGAGAIRYTVLKHEEQHAKMFVGGAGALRRGRNASDSESLGDPRNLTGVYKAYLERGDKALEEQTAAALFKGLE